MRISISILKSPKTKLYFQFLLYLIKKYFKDIKASQKLSRMGKIPIDSLKFDPSVYVIH
jgi:hypothetical protein